MRFATLFLVAITFTLAYMVETGDSLGSALANLRSTAASLRSRQSLWRFVVQQP